MELLGIKANKFTRILEAVMFYFCLYICLFGIFTPKFSSWFILFNTFLLLPFTIGKTLRLRNIIGFLFKPPLKESTDLAKFYETSTVYDYIIKDKKLVLILILVSLIASIILIKLSNLIALCAIQFLISILEGMTLFSSNNIYFKGNIKQLIKNSAFNFIVFIIIVILPKLRKYCLALLYSATGAIFMVFYMEFTCKLMSRVVALTVMKVFFISSGRVMSTEKMWMINLRLTLFLIGVIIQYIIIYFMNKAKKIGEMAAVDNK